MSNRARNLRAERIAVLGGRGMLGTALAERLRSSGSEVAAHDLPEFDITDLSQLKSAVSNASAVVNCAAYTNVDGAEAEPDAAEAVNARAVSDLGRIAQQTDCYVLHISTDFVFDGKLERPYAEDDEPKPLSTYGRTKLAGERAVQASGCRCAVVRVQWTYGRGGRNFVTKLLERAASGTELRMVTDQTGSPTWTRDVSDCLAELLCTEPVGLFHYAARGYATRFEVAEFILRTCGIRTPLQPCRTADFPAAARRPLNSRFRCDKIDSLLSRPRPVWQESLEEYLREEVLKGEMFL